MFLSSDRISYENSISFDNYRIKNNNNKFFFHRIQRRIASCCVILSSLINNVNNVPRRTDINPGIKQESPFRVIAHYDWWKKVGSIHYHWRNRNVSFVKREMSTNSNIYITKINEILLVILHVLVNCIFKELNTC